jgi:hypothetical protein
VIQLTIFISLTCQTIKPVSLYCHCFPYFYCSVQNILPGWTVFSSVHNDPMASDVIAPSPWTIFDCKNGKYKKNLISLHH